MKKTSSKKQQSLVTYEERSVQKFKQALAAEFKHIREKKTELKGSLVKMKDSTIASANLCREIGLHFQTACNHQHINLEFWKNNDCERQTGFTFIEANGFIALSKKMPNKVKTIQEAAPLMQMILITAGLLEFPQRDEQQNSVSVGPFQKFLKEITIVRQDYGKAERQLPMNEWGKLMLQSFLTEIQWIIEKGEMAKKLLEDK